MVKRDVTVGGDIRPTVRGSVMNPNDHPHGGGEGRTPIGRKSPMTPWGKKLWVLKTRPSKKAVNEVNCSSSQRQIGKGGNEK